MVRAVAALLRAVTSPDENPAEEPERERVWPQLRWNARPSRKPGRLARLGLEAMLDHAIATWLAAGAQFEDYADFRRDGYRCTVPGCTARRNLQSHHIRFRSAGGPDAAWNRTTLCAVHHHRGVHSGRLGIRGRAPDGLVYTLGVGRFRSGDVLL